MSYQVQIERRSCRTLDTFPEQDYKRLETAIDSLSLDPRGTRKLATSPPLWRLRVGDYRIIYAVFDAEQLIKVVRVERRTTQTYERF